MIQTIEGFIDVEGQVRLFGEVNVTEPRRALVTILDEPALVPGVAALFAHSALMDWLRPEEEEAWSHLQPVK